MTNDNGKRKLKGSKINEHLSSLDIDVVNKKYISANGLNKKRLHLYGKVLLAT